MRFQETAYYLSINGESMEKQVRTIEEEGGQEIGATEEQPDQYHQLRMMVNLILISVIRSMKKKTTYFQNRKQYLLKFMT